MNFFSASLFTWLGHANEHEVRAALIIYKDGIGKDDAESYLRSLDIVDIVLDDSAVLVRVNRSQLFEIACHEDIDSILDPSGKWTKDEISRKISDIFFDHLSAADPGTMYSALVFLRVTPSIIFSEHATKEEIGRRWDEAREIRHKLVGRLENYVSGFGGEVTIISSSTNRVFVRTTAACFLEMPRLDYVTAIHQE